MLDVVYERSRISGSSIGPSILINESESAAPDWTEITERVLAVIRLVKYVHAAETTVCRATYALVGLSTAKLFGTPINSSATVFDCRLRAIHYPTLMQVLCKRGVSFEREKCVIKKKRIEK